MRESIKQFAKICAETLSISEPIYEFGSLQVPGQEGFADLRPLFHGKKYIGADMREGAGVDKILNLHHIDLPSESVGTVLVLDTLEHVEFPRKAIEEIYRILKPCGILIISSVMNFPIHDYPYDYWRYTPEAFKSLLKPFTLSFVDLAGESNFPHTVIGIGFKTSISENVIREFKDKIKYWKEESYWINPPESGWKGLIKLLTPPILLYIYRKIR
jgi:SAM-dependent methyltransferase